MTPQTPDATTIKTQVRQRYGSLAEKITDGQSAGCCGPSTASAPIDLMAERPAEAATCCGPDEAIADALAGKFYDQGELSGLPDSVTDISLGCGNPTAMASLQPGETVLDLGSGGGIDCFIAARAVGPQGHVIGVDMTPQMLELAARNKEKLGATNVEFRRGEIEALPVEDASVDVIISNCVINLSPDKDAVFRESFRVLKPGGRLAVSDIVTHGEWPAALRANLDAWAGCVTGAEDEAVYLQKMRDAGFTDVRVDSRQYWQAEILDSLDEETRASLLNNVDIDGLPADLGVLSIKVTAYKPGA
ncbi:MAG: arsenite methyltransferase [Anaerolineae bacterium]